MKKRGHCYPQDPANSCRRNAVRRPPEPARNDAWPRGIARHSLAKAKIAAMSRALLVDRGEEDFAGTQRLPFRGPPHGIFARWLAAALAPRFPAGRFPLRIDLENNG